jgi:hypothetical protein
VKRFNNLAIPDQRLSFLFPGSIIGQLSMILAGYFFIISDALAKR